jgi:site-specific recombinase XerD
MHIMTRSQRKGLTFSYALRSFVGYLEGTGKAAHTIKNYRSDLVTLQEFLDRGLGSHPVELGQVTFEDLEKFHGWLKQRGLKTNTRRRKILTARKLLRYLHGRKKLALDAGGKIPAPSKVERVPRTLEWSELSQAIRELAPDAGGGERQGLLARNQALLWTLAETGCQVSEIGRMRFGDWTQDEQGQPLLRIPGKSPRQVPISADLLALIRALPGSTEPQKPVFLGFNRHGSLGAPITSRGVELLVKAYAARLRQEDLTPRIFRHSAVRRWFSEGVSQEEIQRRLGLRTAYAFRIYEPMLRSMSETTSTG